MNNHDNQGAGDQEGIEKLRELIHGIEIGMLTTVDPTDGTLRSRPMSTNGNVEFDGDLWFFTYAAAHKVDEIEREPQVNVSFSRPDKQEYVSLSGTAQLVRERARIEALWQPHLKAWFPQGKDTPDIALLRVRVEKAEYWDSPSGLVAHIFGLARATLTGRPAGAGENKKITLEP
jgi:general stress protein 26